MEDPLTGRVVRGVSWTGAAHVADYVVTVASLSILAHLLSAADFGAQAAAATVVGVALMVGDLGLGSALIQTPCLRRGDARRASVVCMASGLALSGLTLALAPWISPVFQGGEGVRDLLNVLWLCALLHPAGAIPRALMTRRMDFRRLALIDAAAAIASGAAAVALAVRGAGAQSLAWGYVVRVALSSGLAWAALPRKPGQTGLVESASADLGEGAQAFTPVLRFGLHTTGAGVLNYLSANVDYLLVGRYLGPTPLGLYYLAYQLVSQAHFKMVSILFKVLLPALSAVQDDLERLRRGYLRAVRGIALFAFPLLAMLWALAHQVVTVLYGPEKQGVALLVEVLCLMGIAKSVGGAVGLVFVARGRADVSLLWNVFALAATSVAVAVGIPFGLEGVAAAVSLNALLLLAISEGVVHRLIPLDFRAYLGALTPAFLCAAFAGAAVKCGTAVARPHLLPSAVLICGAAFGAMVYGASIYVFHRKAASEAMEFIRAWKGS